MAPWALLLLDTLFGSHPSLSPACAAVLLGALSLLVIPWPDFVDRSNSEERKPWSPNSSTDPKLTKRLNALLLYRRISNLLQLVKQVRLLTRTSSLGEC
ncbi:MAG: hypothetical protein QOJ64_3779 [Acidobacteriota bacterium]|nr:hypothetical protein [Acidobacteriota bacterium]